MVDSAAVGGVSAELLNGRHLLDQPSRFAATDRVGRLPGALGEPVFSVCAFAGAVHGGVRGRERVQYIFNAALRCDDAGRGRGILSVALGRNAGTVVRRIVEPTTYFGTVEAPRLPGNLSSRHCRGVLSARNFPCRGRIGDRGVGDPWGCGEEVPKGRGGPFGKSAD